MSRIAPTRRAVLQGALAAPFILKAVPSFAATTSVKFSLAAPFDGSTAAYFLAQQNGWYEEAGLDCQFDAGGGSGEAVSRVGSGVYQAGIGDINSMAEFNAKNPDAGVRCVYMVYFNSPLSVCTLAGSGIEKPSDLNGKTIGAAAPDGAYRLFNVYSKLAGIDPATITWNMVGLQLREAVLASKDAEAILGFDSTIFFGLQKAGIPAENIKFFYYTEAGLDLYGNGILLSKDFRTSNPEAAKAFVAVTARAWQAAATDPAAAIAALKSHSPLINEELELAKLKWLIEKQLTTPESVKNGLGAIDPERLNKDLAAVAGGFGFPTVPTADDAFDPSFLPDSSLMKLPA